MGRAGLMGLMGPPDRPPQLPSFQLADIGGGLWTVIGILAALRERDRTGQGGVVDIAMTDGVVPFATSALSKLFGGELPRRGGEHLTGGIAPYGTYFTKDREAVTLGALEPKFLKSFCRAAGLDFDPTALVVGPHQDALKEKFAAVFASKTRAEWERLGAEHDCMVEPVLRPDELLEDAHLKARNIFFEVAAGDHTFHEYRTPVTPRDLDATPAPKTGEHTDVILREAGLTDDEIASLRASGVVA
jgi:crotonobetainyl-CoA:carnitine CoA-transferase CaiB-like acyl-CoA transferase